MMQLLQAVVQQGTGAAALQLKHPLGGKTGTTNDYTDAWFIGFSPSVTCGTWIGYDNSQSLGEKETGARAALPMWMDFMRAVIAKKPNETFATAGAPKKKLDVAGASAIDPVKRAAPASVNPETTSPAPSSVAKPAAPNPASTPSAPHPAKPGESFWVTPHKSAPTDPAKPITAPARSPAPVRPGASQPPPGTN
jgi:penicillin-binding protein 1A